MSEQFTLAIKTAEVTIPQAIENIEELKMFLAPKMEEYSSLIVTESGIKEAKGDRAKLNKLKTAIEEQRKGAKKMCLSLYEPLEKQCKELVAMIDAPIEAIDKQIKYFEEIEKENKYNELKAYFESVNDISFLVFEDVLNPKWSNKTVNLDTLKAEITANIKRIADDYDEISKLYRDSPLLTAILNKFVETKDKSPTLVYAATIEAQYKQEQECKAKEIELQRQRENVPNAAESVSEIQSEVIPETTQTTVKNESEQSQGESTITGAFKVTCTIAQLKALRDFMKSTGIKFEVIKLQEEN